MARCRYCIGFPVDGATIVTQRALLDTSYAVHLRIMRRVVTEESLHFGYGEDILLALAAGTRQQLKMMLQEAVRKAVSTHPAGAHWLYDHADCVRLATLTFTGSSDPEIAAIATKLAHQ